MRYKEEDWNLILPAIQELLIDGYTLPQVAKKLDLTYNKVIHYYKPIKKNFKYIDYQQKQRKVEAVNASAFSFNKIYTWESLSEEDIKGYKYYESKHKAYYEHT